VLECVQKLSNNAYIAHFAYTNRNDVAVHIPEGEDNQLLGNGIDRGASDPVPVVFEPGGGQFSVTFDGSELRWTVNSLDEDHKSSNIVNVNSSSTKCNKNFGKGAGKELSEPISALPLELELYPNPAGDVVKLRMEGLENYRQISIHDVAGKTHLISTSLERNSTIQLDLSDLDRGSYFVRVVMEDEVKVATFIKQ
jgi:hypothetical protein